MTADDFMAEVDRQLEQMGIEDQIDAQNLEIVVPPASVSMFYREYLEMCAMQSLANQNLPLETAMCAHEFARTDKGARCTRCGWTSAFAFDFQMPRAILTKFGEIPVRLSTGKDILVHTRRTA